MSKFKKGLMKRVMAIILSGAMVMSGMTSSNMTAFASEAPADTGGYVEEVDDDVSEGDSTGSESDDKDEVENNAETESTSEDAATEETTKSENNASNGEDDVDDNKETAVETVEATDTEVADDEQTSEMGASLDTETEEAEETETTTEDEDIKEDTLQEMESNQTYSFSADDLSVGNITENPLLGNGYFALQCGDATNVAIDKKTFRRFNAATNQIAGVGLTNRLYLGGAGNTSSQSVKFITRASVDVIVYWVSNGANAQMTILDNNGKTVAETFEAAGDAGILVSRMTLEKAGTYYLEGNSYIYKVEVMPASNLPLETNWDFTDDSKFPPTTAVENTGNITSIESKTAEEFHGLYIDTTGGGKWKKNSGQVQVNTNTIIYIPLEKRSKVTINFGGQYTVDGVSNTGNPSTFTCTGEGGYATVKVSQGTTNFKSIKVDPIGTIEVAGDITLSPEKAESYKIIFTEKKDNGPKTVIESVVENNHYSANLYKGVTYVVSLSDKSYSVTKNGEITIEENASDTSPRTWDVEAEGMSLTDITGGIEFLDRDGQEVSMPDNLSLKFTSKGEGTPHIPEVTIDKDKKEYSVSLENDSTYTITAEGTGIKEYDFSPTELSANASDTKISFVEKEKFEIGTEISSDPDINLDLSKISVTFTDPKDDSYKYSFKLNEDIFLRKDTYDVKLDVPYPHSVIAPETFTVNGNSTQDVLELEFSERMIWDFTKGDPMLTLSSALQSKPEQEFNGLLIDTSTKTLTGDFIDASGQSTNTFNTNGKFEVQVSNKRVQVNSSTEIKIPVSGKGTVQIVNNQTQDTNHYTIDGVKATTEPQTWRYDKPAASYDENGNYIPGGYITLQVIKTKISKDPGGTIDYTHSDSIYLEKIIVEREKEIVIPPGTRMIDIWDFGGKVDDDKTDVTKYTNNITPDAWKSADIITTEGSDKGKFKGGSNTSYSYSFGDLTMNYIGQDRMYSTLEEMSTIVVGEGKGTADYNYTEDGYKAEGGWYCNGSGDANTRNITIKNVLAGDKIVVYAGQHLSGNDFGPIIYHFDGQGSAGVQKDSESIGGTSRVFKRIEFIAEYNGTYKIWPECLNSAKPLYNRIVRIPGVAVSGTVDFGGYTGSDYTIKFVNQSTKQESIVNVKEDNSFIIALAPGYTYTAVLSGAPGYGFTSESKTLDIPEDSSEIKNVKLEVETKAQYTFGGKLTGFEEGYDISRLTITMIPPAESNVDEVELLIDKEEKSFTALLDRDVEYTVQMEGVDDYKVKTPLKVSGTGDVTEDITVELKTRHTVSGGFIGLGDAEITELKFILLDEKGNQDANYIYTADVTSDSYSAQLRDGAYIAKATVDGYKTQTHVVVSGKDTVKDLMFVSTAADSDLERVANLYVGYPNRPHNYNTIREAVKAAKRMKPSSEAERITIHILPGLYREQVIVDVPYITFTNDNPDEEVKITWYYGIGYAYYSSKNGFYDEERAHDKYEKANADKWGCAVRVAASDFRAENITFENSFNRYITEEEIKDGVELRTAGTDSKATFVRKAGMSDAQIASKAATERAAAVAIDGNRAEFYQCKFYGSQDTVYTGSSKHANQSYTYSYFKDCFIEGNTDFLFGDSNSVYENCVLSFAGYSDTDKKYGGIIAVNKADAQHGYLFNECTITRGKTYNNGYGDLGRPWAKDARVVFMNTKQETADIVTARGWENMNTQQPAKDNPNYKEYHTTLLDGTEITLEAGSVRQAKYKTEKPVEDITVYFDGWTPFYLSYDASQTVREPASNEKRSDVPKGTKITLTSATTDATIYYTLDGTDPTAESEKYTTPIDLGDEERTVTIKAIAIKGDVKSNIAVFEYTVKDAADLIAVPTATVEPGIVDKGTHVKLECATENADIYYTTDGTNPTVKAELLYRGQAIVINETTTIKAIASKGGNTSSVVEFVYTVIIPETIDPPTASVNSGEVLPAGTKVTLSAAAGTKIYYTMDGTEPTESSTEYTTAIDLGNEAKKVVIKAIAVKDGVKSSTATFEYTISADIDPDKFVSAPVSDITQGEVEKGTKVTLTSATKDAKIYYTLDGTNPTAESAEYTAPIDLGNEAKQVVIKAIAIKGENKSSVSTFEYTVTEGGVSGDNDQVKAPEASPAEGAVASGTEVRLTSATEDAKIYYTTDGTEPTTESSLYTDPITITSAVTIKAFAVKEGLKDSAVVTFAYTITSGPVIPADPDDPGIDKNDIWITGLEDTYVYTGAKIIPDIKVWDCDIKGGDRLLAPGVDYTVAYKNNVKPGTKTAEVIITGKGNYAGKGVTEKFSIKEADDVQNPVNVKGAKIDKIGDMKYSGKALYPDFKLTLKDKTSFEYIYDSEIGRYTRKGSGEMNVNIAVSNNVNKGTATILVTGGKDKGKTTSVKATFKITPIDLSAAADVKVTPSPAVYAVNGAVPETLTVTCGEKQLVKGIDYTVKYSGNKKAGTAGTVTVTGKGNYTKKVKPVAYTINKLDMSQLSVNAVTVYEGITAGKIKATVVDKSGNALKPAQYTLKIYKEAEGGTPYDAKDKTKLTAGTVIYVEATAAAKETNLTGSTPRAAFTVGKDISKAKFVLTQKKGLPYTGSAIELTEKDLTVTMKNVTGSLKMGEDYVITAYSNNINKGTATAVIKGIGDYSGTKTVKFKITQKTMKKGTLAN